MSEQRPTIPANVDPVIQKALQRVPADQSAGGSIPHRKGPRGGPAGSPFRTRTAAGTGSFVVIVCGSQPEW